jgi:Ca2+-binding RTX toxin-like protein
MREITITGLALMVVSLGVASCREIADDPSTNADEQYDEAESALGIRGAIIAGDKLGDIPYLCEDLRSQPKLLEQYQTHYNLVKNQSNGTIHGTPHPDIIFGTSQDDQIYGEGGDDIICAGSGKDIVYGGLGRDRIYGESGNDTLHGGNSGDWIHGGDGEDAIYGDVLDDKLYGDNGDDLLIGGHGVDHMFGGQGSDWLRGDTNKDLFDGGSDDNGADEDVASFMTARPSGIPSPGRTGVFDDQQDQGGVLGDGVDTLDGVERVIGSAFDDRIQRIAKFEGSYGTDECAGTCERKGPVPASMLPFVFTDIRPQNQRGRSGDSGVIILGSLGPDNLTFSRQGHMVIVTDNNHNRLYPAGPECFYAESSRTDIVACTPGDQLRYLMAWGDAGDDKLQLGDGFRGPKTDAAYLRGDFAAYLDGGEGSDELNGGDSDDILFTGRSGFDQLYGHGGDDALISETYKDDEHRLDGGRDILDGGGGNDQLVTDHPCNGHEFHGGHGEFDIAGFARVVDHGIRATIGGKAFSLHGPCVGTLIARDLEVLEGTKFADELIGNDDNNTIWGRGGNDTIFGLDGDDVLEGDEEDDEIHGGAGDDQISGGIGDDTLEGGGGADEIQGDSGRDIMRGGSGRDMIYAADGQKDKIINCGPDGGIKMSSDRGDPQAVECGPEKHRNMDSKGHSNKHNKHNNGKDAGKHHIGIGGNHAVKSNGSKSARNHNDAPHARGRTGNDGKTAHKNGSHDNGNNASKSNNHGGGKDVTKGGDGHKSTGKDAAKRGIDHGISAKDGGSGKNLGKDSSKDIARGADKVNNGTSVKEANNSKATDKGGHGGDNNKNAVKNDNKVITKDGNENGMNAKSGDNNRNADKGSSGGDGGKSAAKGSGGDNGKNTNKPSRGSRR